jgi:very-short-patch-repair endonuclease
MGSDGFFTGATAAYLYGLDSIDVPARISVARYSGARGPDWIKVNRLKPDDLPAKRWVKGFRVASVERVLAECCSDVSPRRVGRAIDDALRRRLTTLDRLRKFAEGWGRGRRGARVLRNLVQGRDTRDESVRSTFESKMLVILRRLGEHRFAPNFEVRVDGKKYYLDFFFPVAALGIECHSFRWHMGLHDADARRDRRIRSLGIEILYFTWDDVCYHAAEVEHEIRQAIARRLSIFSADLSSEGTFVEKKR